jgi:type IV secretory pathway TrbD component
MNVLGVKVWILCTSWIVSSCFSFRTDRFDVLFFFFLRRLVQYEAYYLFSRFVAKCIAYGFGLNL